MYNLDLMIQNINKIDRILKESFEKVEIHENAQRSNFYFDVTCQKTIITENGGLKTYQIKSKILKESINRTNIEWLYATNPDNEKLGWIDRTSTIDNFSQDLLDVVYKNKLDESYLRSIKEVFQPINESVEGDSNPSLLDKIGDIISDCVEVTSIDSQKEVVVSPINESMVRKTTIHFNTQEQIPFAKAFELEGRLKDLEGVEYVVFSGKKISVHLD